MDQTETKAAPAKAVEACHKMKKDGNSSDVRIIPELKDEDQFHFHISDKHINLRLWSDNPKLNLDNACDRLLAVIEPAKNAESVDIGADMWNHMSSEDIQRVLHAVGKLPNLKWLHFSLGTSSSLERNLRRPLSLKTLSFIASTAKQLQYFVLTDVKLEGTKAEWQAFTAALKSHASLVHLRLESYSFEDDAIDLEDLVNSLSHVPTLQSLEIFASEASSSPQSLGRHVPPQAFANLICESKALEVVRFGGLSIGDEHLSLLVDPLSKSKTITELLLWETGITEKGASSLAKALKVNTSLKRLNLNDNDALGSRGCQVLFESILQSLQELYVGCSHMDDTCRDALLRLVASNTGGTDGTNMKKLEVCFSWPLDAPVMSIAEFGFKLGKYLRDTQQVLEYLRFYHSSNHHGDEAGKDLEWGSTWEKRSMEDDDDNDE